MNLKLTSPVKILCLLAAILSASSIRCQTVDSKVDQLADRFVTQQLQYDPTFSYSTGIPTSDHSRFPDRTPQAIERHAAEERADLQQVLALNTNGFSPRAHAAYATLREQLESDLQLRICRSELWDVNHFDGWQSHFANVAEQQPVETITERKQALRRWNSLPRYIDVEISNLELGLHSGYSAPQSVVQRVIRQINAMAPSEAEKSPFFSPAARSSNRAFSEEFRRLILERINPALHRYSEYLEHEYLPNARSSVALSDLPNGNACYAAFLRANTTLTRTPQQVFSLGEEAVAANLAEVKELGEQRYHVSDVAAILAAIKANPEERFHSREELMTFSRGFLERAKSITAEKLIRTMPKQDVVIRPLPAFEEAAGVGSRFQQEPDPAKPAVFLINLGDWKTLTRAEAEISAAHEAVPGHYLQKALAAQLQRPTKLTRFVDNSAYAEGWARYAEGMAEEVSIYDTVDAAILRRLWPARGMVVDPGLHTFHWSRQQAIDYIVASGRFTAEQANDYVDRIAVMPGQLTAYDSGAMEILTLRAKAQAELANRFDLRAFNQAILEEGVIFWVPRQTIEIRSHLQGSEAR